MVLNIFTKKSAIASATPTPPNTTPHGTTTATSSPRERTPKPKRLSPRTSPKPDEPTKGIAYKSTRILLPGGSLNRTPSPEEIPPPHEPITPREQRKKRQSSPNTHTYKSKKANSQDSLNGEQQRTGPSSSSSTSNTPPKAASRIRSRERDRVVSNRSRPLRGSYRDRRPSISSRESLILKGRKAKLSQSNPAKTPRRKPQPNPPYPINDILDNYASDEGNNNDSDSEMPSGFEQVTLRPRPRPRQVASLVDAVIQDGSLPRSSRPRRKNENMEIPRTTDGAATANLEAPRITVAAKTTTNTPSAFVVASTSMEPSSSLQVSNNTAYHDAPEPTRMEAVACILERTGSQARNSRRARRARELRHQESIREGSSSDHQEQQQQQEDISNSTLHPMSDVRLPILITPDLNSHARHSSRINLQQSHEERTPTSETPQRHPVQEEEQHTQVSQPQEQQPPPRQRPTSTLEETRNAIIARLNARVDVSMFSMDLIDPPPLDEYSPSLMPREPVDDYSPPYREHLHRKVDLISFDPRYSIPVLRINKKLIKNKKNLKKVILKLIKLRIVPEDVNLWEINKVDDGEFYNVLPGLIHSVELQHHQSERLQQRPEEYENDIQRAIALSLEEENQRELYRGFRYQQRSGANNSSTRVIEQVVQSPDFDLNHGRFIDPTDMQQPEQQDQQNQEESDTRRDLFRGFRYNQSRRSRAAEEVIHSPMLQQIIAAEGEEEEELTEELEEIEDEFIDVDQAISNWYHEEQQQQLLSGLLSAPRFGYLLPHHTQSSTSSFMTARHGLSV
ncbi:hypothetical protein Cantr_05377 [Candida viswanathii]|uniref:Uncharacterized protein n=1 Tax=Candida viswanathii TaxID=5486 RepID=A0A367XRZ4_9ASCO|nr:hypothetical protein Cantr_05377 [Candida viswanathii]